MKSMHIMLQIKNKHLHLHVVYDGPKASYGFTQTGRSEDKINKKNDDCRSVKQKTNNIVVVGGTTLLVFCCFGHFFFFFFKCESVSKILLQPETYYVFQRWHRQTFEFSLLTLPSYSLNANLNSSPFTIPSYLAWCCHVYTLIFKLNSQNLFTNSNMTNGTRARGNLWH